MNARIRELSKLSGLWFVVDREDMVESFGKLLIAECVEIAKECREQDWFDVAGAIEDHFDLKDPPLKVGDRVEVIKGFSVGAHGVIKYIEPTGRMWVLRDRASSDVFYMPEEVVKETV